MKFLVLGALGFALLSGCAGAGEGSLENPGDIGAPCELEDHCAEGLICDFHDDYGSCQEPHGH